MTRTNAILANSTISNTELGRSKMKAVPEGMSWIMRDGKKTTCLRDSFSAIHGFNGPCNCGYFGRAHRTTAH